MKPANPFQDMVKSDMGKAVPLILGGIHAFSAATAAQVDNPILAAASE